MENNFTIFVKGLHPRTEEEDLRKYFEGHGKIKKIILKKDKSKNISRGFAFVSFESMEDCQRILSATHKIDGKKVVVTYAMTPTEALKTKSRKVAGAGSLIISKIPLSVDRQDLLACLEQRGEVVFLSDFLRSTNEAKYVFASFADPSVGAKLVGERRLHLQHYTFQVYPQTENELSEHNCLEQSCPEDIQENFFETHEKLTWQLEEQGYDGIYKHPYPSPEEPIANQEDHWPEQTQEHRYTAQKSYFVPPAPVRPARVDGRWRPSPPYHQNWPTYGYSQTLQSQNQNLLPKYSGGISFPPHPYANFGFRGFGGENHNETNMYPRQAFHSAQYRLPDHERSQINHQPHANSYIDTGHAEAGGSSDKTKETRDEAKVEWLKQEISRLEQALKNLRHLLQEAENNPNVNEQ